MSKRVSLMAFAVLAFPFLTGFGPARPVESEVIRPADPGFHFTALHKEPTGSRVWAVSRGATAPVRIDEWDGGRWSRVLESKDVMHLEEVDAIHRRGEELFVGGYSPDRPQGNSWQAKLLRSVNGGPWETEYTHPGYSGVSAIAGSADGACVWAVGTELVPGVLHGTFALALRREGGRWTRADTSSLPRGEGLIGILVKDCRRVFAIARSYVARWDGTTWQVAFPIARIESAEARDTDSWTVFDGASLAVLDPELGPREPWAGSEGLVGTSDRRARSWSSADSRVIWASYTYYKRRKHCLGYCPIAPCHDVCLRPFSVLARWEGSRWTILDERKDETSSGRILAVSGSEAWVLEDSAIRRVARR